VKKVKNIASPTTTWFGGIVVVPMAWRIKLRTIRILVNDVVINKIAGATDRTVSKMSILIAGATELGSSRSLRLILRVEGFFWIASAKRGDDIRNAVAERIRFFGPLVKSDDTVQ